MARGYKQLRNWFTNKSSEVIRSGGFDLFPPVFGKAFYVDPDHANATDTNNPGTDRDHPLKTLAVAYEKLTSNNHDVIFLNAVTTHSLTSMLTWAKNRCHLVALDGGGRLTAQRGKIELTGSSGATNIAAIKVTGTGNTFHNLKIMNSHTVAQSLYALIDGGEANGYFNCSFHNLAAQQLTTAGAAPLLLGGDGSTFRECEIGADTVKVTVASSQVILVDASAAGATAKRVYFDDCTILLYSSQATHVGLRVDAEADLDRFIFMKGCNFINFDNSTGATLTNAIYTPASMDGGRILIAPDCAIFGISGWATAPNNAGIKISSPVPTANTSGIGITPTHA